MESYNSFRGHSLRIAVGKTRRMDFQPINKFFFISIVSLLLIGSSAAQDSLVILNSSDFPTMLQNVKYIESIGGTIAHRFPPHILIGNIPADHISNLKGHMNIVDIVTEPLNVSSVSDYGRTTEIAVNVWNNNYLKKATEEGLVSVATPEPGPIIGDMLNLPENTKRGVVLAQLPNTNGQIKQALIQPYMAEFYDTSEYMIGNVTVGIIFLESNGSIDPDTENWTSIEEYNVISQIQAGLNWWKVREPKAKLTFTYDIHYRISTSYEPITRPAPAGELLWVADAISNLGYIGRSTYFDNVYDYENSIRKLANADWAFTIFVIDSSNDPDGKFADDHIAYSYRGGPFMVINYKNGGYGISNMDAAVAHETGHIFYALDQYTSSNSSCTERSGYLGIQNQNSAFPFPGACLSNVDSIMRDVISGYTNGLIDAYARQQVGWRDSNANGILDIIDFLPSSTLNVYTPDPTNDNTPTYTGSSTTILTYPNMNPYGQKHKITINKIADVQYRVNGDIWINASPAEGFFDSSKEGFVFTVPQLSDGTHTIEVRALNTAGNWETAYSNDTLSIDTHPPISISNLTNINYAAYYINWTWMDPQDTDFDKVMIYLDGIFQTNITNGNQYYNATGLIPATTYEISTRTADLAGNINETWVNRSGTTTPLPDTTAPGSVTNLQNITYAWAYINWTWTDPQDADFDHVDVYLEGVSKGIVMKGTKFYNVTGLSSNTSYTIGLKSVDTSGNLNSSIVTHSARTAPLPDTTSPLGTLNITSFAPLLHVSDNVEATRTFNITINQLVNVAWYINGTEVFNQTGINESSYTNASAAVGTWTINATATNANGTVSHEWTWTVAVYLKGDLNGNGIPADAGDLVLMKQASIGEIQANSRYDLNNNGIPADAGDLVLMKRASIGEFQFGVVPALLQPSAT